MKGARVVGMRTLLNILETIMVLTAKQVIPIMPG